MNQDISDGILDWNFQSNLIHLSSQLLKMIGYDGEQSTLSVNDWCDLIHPDDREYVINRVHALSTKQVSSLEMRHRLRCRDGMYRVYQVYGKGCQTNDSEPENLFLFYNNTSNRIYTEETAEQRAAILQALLNVLPDFLIRMDGDGIYLDFLCGGDVEVYCATGRFIGELIYDILPQDIAHQRMFYVRQALETGDMQTYDYEFPIDGNLIYEEARILKIRDNEVLVIVRDITERKTSELLLHKILEREQAIARILDRMRQTLDISQVFSTTVQEIRHVLKCDRVVIYQFNLDWSGQFVAESVAAPWTKLLEHDQINEHFSNAANQAKCCIKQTAKVESLTDTYLQETEGGRYRTGSSYQRVDDIYQENFDPCYVELLEQIQARSYIITPILHGDNLWGLFGIYQNATSRRWEDEEVRAVVQVGIQLAIAIQQASLFSQLNQKIEQQEQTLQKLKETKLQLIQAEKLSGLGQLVAGIAHELNNPISYVSGNIAPIHQYVNDLLSLINLYQQEHPNSSPKLQDAVQRSDLDFLKTDLPKALASIEIGSQRILEIVTNLKSFSRLDQDGKKSADVNEGIGVTLRILENRLKAYDRRPAIGVEKHFSQLPLVECYPAQINQVLMNLIVNAIDAIDERIQKEFEANQDVTPGMIEIATTCLNNQVTIQISDNGSGIPTDIQKHIFDPFFTTKSVGKGTGLGLAISHQIIVANHDGQIKCISTPGVGTKMVVEIPVIATLTPTP